MKKNILTGLAVVTLLSVGASTVSVNNSVGENGVVQAATKTKKLIHNAYVYNSKGKRIKKVKAFKKGTKVRVYGYKTIKGKKYAHIGKNKYIKATNFKDTKKKVANTKTVNDPKLAEYKKWETTPGVILALKDTAHFAKGEMMDLSDGGTWADGEFVIKNNTYIKVLKKDGQYYLDLGYGKGHYDKAEDFKFIPYTKANTEYNNYVNQIKKNMNEYGNVYVVLTKDYIKSSGLETDKNGVYDAYEPSIVLDKTKNGKKLEYCLLQDGTEIPFSAITGFAKDCEE